MKSWSTLFAEEVSEDFFNSASSADYRNALAEFGLDMVALDTIAEDTNLTFCSDETRPNGIGKLTHLEWDSNFFSCKSARIESLYFRDNDPNAYQTRLKLIDDILRGANDNGYKFLSCRITAEDTLLAYALEENGFRICDILNIYVSESVAGEPIGIDERDEAAEILDNCIEGLIWGRVHQDPMIDPVLAKKFYRDTSAWILSQECHVTIARENGRGVGFAIGLIDRETTEIMGRRHGILWLIAVDPKFQGRGIGKNLLDNFKTEFSPQIDLLEIGTQVSNVAANRMYLRAGYRPLTQALTFHRWDTGSKSN